jgi:hypothetical protein
LGLLVARSTLGLSFLDIFRASVDLDAPDPQ